MLTATVHPRSVREKGLGGLSWLPALLPRLPGQSAGSPHRQLVALGGPAPVPVASPRVKAEKPRGLGWLCLSPGVPWSLVVLPCCPEYGATCLNPLSTKSTNTLNTSFRMWLSENKAR